MLTSNSPPLSTRRTATDMTTSQQRSVAPLLFLAALFVPRPVSALNSDGLLLLSFKNSVLSDPLATLAGWSHNNDTPCSWNGVACASIIVPGNATADHRVISLVLPNSQLMGSLPPELGSFEHLRRIDLSGNYLNGTLPASLFNASELRILSLANNDISGELPEPAGRASPLQVFNLSDNALTGRIPRNLSMLPNLTVVSLASNYISGGLPSGGFGPRLQVLDLSSNLLNGSLPRDLGGVRAGIQYLNLSYNRLAGKIPLELGLNMNPWDAELDLSYNNFTGEIPQSAAFLAQKWISFAGNPDLCGRPLRNQCTVPSTLLDHPVTAQLAPKSPPALAAIPRDPNVDSSRAAAGSGRRSGGLRPKVILVIIIGDLGGIGLLFVVFLYLYNAKKKRKQQEPRTNKQEKKPPRPAEFRGIESLACCLKKKSSDSEGISESSSSSSSSEAESEDQQNAGNSEAQQRPQQGAILVTVDNESELELETLLKASAYILGATGSSIVYKAVLADGTALAVRRVGDGGSTTDRLKDFEAQVRSIAKFRHPNLLPVRGFYWGADEKLLIHDYAPNGSLANISFTKKLSSSPFHLSWEARLRIAKGVAGGLAYLHDKKCVHGNIKPGNILLSGDMEPLIGDFGLERLMPGDAHSKSARHFGSKRSCRSLPDLSTAAATASDSPCGSPYQAPESLKNLKPSAKWDVYSFGVVLLELLAGRLFSEAELSQWNAGFVVEERNRVLRMADPALRGEVEGKEVALLVCFKLGFACTAVAPQRRPSMADAAQVLDKIPSSRLTNNNGI